MTPLTVTTASHKQEEFKRNTTFQTIWVNPKRTVSYISSLCTPVHKVEINCRCHVLVTATSQLRDRRNVRQTVV